ncbi:DUF3038 domain-containing protein [Chamaesiphon polymorphus]|uniref:DUF3038 domain-containing protein n=1 Tax=Chamaesiphon polymorphus CCALA 037 TaxID=2107692 RepID=A0A2T1GM80_9CYAN|nr:DUF3038 domain-containing protein [Chamaesiphon polymorphus]PSB58998.1 hypothetical protein C7B77_02555 [Chamaesiphon polymorphus CCALA 037]
MLSIQMMPASNPKLDELLITSQLAPSHLYEIAREVDLVAIAIMAMTQLDRVALQQVARDLELDSIVSGWVENWPSNRNTYRSSIDIQLLRALVIILHHLAREHHSLLRRNISYWQKTNQYHQLPLQSPSLADYIGNFITMYQTRFGADNRESFETLTETALNLLIDLLFYSSPNGHQRLWNALLQRAARFARGEASPTDNPAT